VIGFNHIIHVLIEDMKVGGQQLIEHPEVGRCPIGGHLGRARAVLESLGKEREWPQDPRFCATTSMTRPNWSIARYK
jgi:hypothetical protein